MKRGFVLLPVLWCLVLSGCLSVSSFKDPFGAYEARMTIEARRTEAQETMARYERDARIAEAEQAAWARVGSARAWAGAVPLLGFLAGVTVIAVVYIRWNGRVTLARLKYGYGPFFQFQTPTLPATLSALQQQAAKRNQQVRVVGGVALLIDNATSRVVKRRRLLKG
jgi:hypothetical protein